MNFDELCECGKTFWDHRTFTGFVDAATRKGWSEAEAKAADGFGACEAYRRRLTADERQDVACEAYRRRLTADERQDVLADIIKIREALC